MLRRMMVATTIAALLPAAAGAQDDVMAGYYGNTVVSTGGMAEVHTHYWPDHSFDVASSAMGRSLTSKGTWKIDDHGQLCRIYDKPPPTITNPVCTELQPHKPGDKWTATFNGRSRDVTMVAGVQ